jgi:tetratricopeptide (TPR) repeat protein
MIPSLEYKKSLHSFKYNLSLYSDNIDEFMLKGNASITEMMDEAPKQTLMELSPWCNTVNHFLFLANIAGEYMQKIPQKQFLDKAISKAETYLDCFLILKANLPISIFPQKIREEIYHKACVLAEYSWEFLGLAELEYKNMRVAFCVENSLEQAIEKAIVFSDYLELGKFYQKLRKDEDKAMFWFRKAIDTIENDEDREEFISYLMKISGYEELKGEIFEQFYHQTQSYGLKLRLFFSMESKYWEHSTSINNWAELCHDCMLIQNWEFLESISDKFYRPGAKVLRKLLEKHPVVTPDKSIDMIHYARFMKLLYCNKQVAEKWIQQAFQKEIDRDELELEPFLKIAVSASTLLKDNDLAIKVLEEAESRLEGVKEYLLVMDTLTKIGEDNELINRYALKCLRKRYPTVDYYQLANFVLIHTKNERIVNRALVCAMRNAESYFEASLICSFIKLHEQMHHENRILELLNEKVTSVGDFIDLAYTYHFLNYPDKVNECIDKAEKLVKSTEEFSLMIRFVYFSLSNYKKAKFFLECSFECAFSASDFKLFAQDAMLMFGLEWKKAF